MLAGVESVLSGNNCRSKSCFSGVTEAIGDNSAAHRSFRPFSTKNRVDINCRSEISLGLSHRIQF